VTDSHHIYSVDRRAFVPAGELRIGETLQLKKGHTQVTRIEPVVGMHKVFNLEVHGEHVFRVTINALLVHNNNHPGSGGSGTSGGFDTEYETIEDAIDDTGQIGPRTLDVRPTTNPDIRDDMGFTEMFRVEDSNGDIWTLFFNPDTLKFGGEHLSGDQIH
jgi:hypothetical protein